MRMGKCMRSSRRSGLPSRHRSARRAGLRPPTTPSIDDGRARPGHRACSQKGRSVTVTASETVCPNTGYCVSPDGTSVVDTTQSNFGGFVLPGAPAYGLVGRVGSGHGYRSAVGRRSFPGRGRSCSRSTMTFSVTTGRLHGHGVLEGIRRVAHVLARMGQRRPDHEHCGPPGLANKPPPPGQTSQPTQGHSSEHGDSQENEHGNSQGNGNSKNK